MTPSIGIYGLHYYDRRENIATCHGYFEDEAEAQTRARRKNDAGTTTGSRWYVTEAVLHFKELAALLTDPDVLAGKHLSQAEQDEHRRCLESIVEARRAPWKTI